jgi:hypothetical protein
MRTGKAIRTAAVLWLIAIGPSAAEQAVPAELPPKDYAGQQYVDSKGCMFLRAGPKGNETWIPRVTRDGVPLCDNPPSGRRVPVAGEDQDANREVTP